MTQEYLNATNGLLDAVSASYKKALAQAAEAIENSQGKPDAEQQKIINAPAEMHDDLMKANGLHSAAVSMSNAKITDEQIGIIAGLIKVDAVKAEPVAKPAKKK